MVDGLGWSVELPGASGGAGGSEDVFLFFMFFNDVHVALSNLALGLGFPSFMSS